MGILLERVRNLLKSNRRIAKEGRKEAKSVKIIMDDMENLFKEVGEKNIKTLSMEEAAEDIDAIIELIKEEIIDEIDIERKAEYEEYELIKLINKLRSELAEKNKELAEKYNSKFDELIQKAKDDIMKIRREIHDALVDRERMVKYRDGIMGKKGKIREIRKKERKLRKEITEERTAEKQILRETDPGKMEGELKEFLDAAEDEVNDLYIIEHDDIILIFDVIADIHHIQGVLNTILQKGFPQEEGKILTQHVGDVQSMLNQSLEAVSRTGRQIKNM